MECWKRYSYSSCGVALSLDVGIENVVDVAAAAGRDNDEIRYGSLKFLFADYVIEGGSEGFDYYELVVMFLACNDC